MKFLKTGLSLVLLGAGLAAVPGLQADAAGTSARASGQSLVQQMRGEADGAIKTSTERATGRIGFVRASRDGDLMPSKKADSLSTAVDKANAYVAKYAPAFGATAAQLQQSGVQSGTYGWSVSFKQSYKGVPVFGAVLKANLDRAGDLISVNGYAAPGLNLSVAPRVSSAKAATRALATVRAVPPGGARTDVSGIKAVTNTLSVYRMGSIKGDAGKSVLAYIVEVSNRANVRDMVFVDANTDKVINRYSMVDNSLERHLIEAAGGTDPSTFTEVWAEGDPFPGALNEDQQNEVVATGDAYWFFKNSFGRDSYDALGHSMTTVNNDGRIQCPNANWNGATTNYCDGVTSDDVVAHEWGHAYTEYTSGLIYQWQPGAMNEAYSDIWGETVDLIDGQMDADEGDLTVKRPVGKCSTHSPVNALLTLNSPASVAKECLTGGFLGPAVLAAPITGDIVIPTDAVDEGGTATDGCSTYDNPAAAAGKIAMVDRGLCTFVQKAQVAKAAGVAALIIGNRDDSPIGFSDADTTLPVTVSIGLTDRELIRTAITNGDTVNATISDASGERVDSYRWLMGEDSSAFGGAIRDMWSPTCYGDPGKVTDAEYKCSTDDAGGVHGNSGVVNHSYALLADGGTYNGVDVTGVGLTKAAAIFWLTQDTKLTPTSDFQDLADGLAASCTQLIGADINELSTAADGTPTVSDEKISQADCDSVSDVAQATELSQEPVQCNFQPMLAKNAPASCGSSYKSVTVWKDGFETGFSKNWKQSERVVYPGGHGYKWKATGNYPHGGVFGNHSSAKVAYDPSPDEGDCSGGPGDISSANAITGPKVKLPSGKFRRLTFDHYMATEPGFDGGNVKISVNGGAFKVVPAAAYVFNGPDLIATADEGNSSPLAGEEGFTGTDGGVVNGSWGRSIIDLKGAGAKAGDSVKIRFELGRDGCGGNDGWYVDNVKFVVCKKKSGRAGERATLGRSTAKH